MHQCIRAYTVSYKNVQCLDSATSSYRGRLFAARIVGREGMWLSEFHRVRLLAHTFFVCFSVSDIFFATFCNACTVLQAVTEVGYLQQAEPGL